MHEKKIDQLKSITAYERIRDLILSRKKLPGARLVIADLESELGIGRGAIREALMRLDKSGLVQTLPHRGAIVSHPPSLEEIKYIYEMRIELEAKLSVRAMENMDDVFLSGLWKIYGRMLTSVTSRLDYYELDRELHRMIYNQSGLHHLCLISEKMMESLEVFLGMYSYQRSDFAKLNEEHCLIIEALEKRDSGLLEDSVKKNVHAGLRMIIKLHNHYE